MTDRIEFYRKGGGLIATVESSIVPLRGDLISIRGQTWEVTNITYALDHSDGPPSQRVMRANIDLEARGDD